MTTPAIIERVRELQSELEEVQPNAPTAGTETIDNVRKALDMVMLDPGVTAFASLRDQLLLASIAFQNDNPKLAGAMQGLVAELSAAGL